MRYKPWDLNKVCSVQPAFLLNFLMLKSYYKKKESVKCVYKYKGTILATTMLATGVKRPCRVCFILNQQNKQQCLMKWLFVYAVEA